MTITLLFSVNGQRQLVASFTGAAVARASLERSLPKGVRVVRSSNPYELRLTDGRLFKLLDVEVYTRPETLGI